jgi:hypothetical protein
MSRYPLSTQVGIPPVVVDYELDAKGPWFAVIIPEGSTNLCINPSFETNTTGWSAGAGTLSRVSTYQRFGTYSAKYQPSAAVADGLYYGVASASSFVTTTAGQWYTASFFIKGAGGAPFKVYWADFNGNQLGQALTFNCPNDWGRVINVSYYELQSGSRRLYITKNGSTSLIPWYIDGVLIENKAYSTTYFDGDQVGYVTGVTDFYWTGPRHASTSVRSAQTGAGGKVVKLKDLGFTLLAIVGLGMAPMKPLSQDYGWQNGALYQRTRIPSRDFTLAGYISGITNNELKRNRAQLEKALSPDNLATQQPLTLLYDYTDECGISYGETLVLPCLYNGGLPGKTDNLYGEKVAITFTMYLPLVMNQSEEGASLNFTQTITNTAFAASKINGQWQAMGTGFSNSVYFVLPDMARGRIWYAGTFATAPDGQTVNKICYYDLFLKKFVAVGGATKGIGGAAATIYSLALDANGNVWVAGDSNFNAAGGAATKSLARWNNATDTFTVFNLAGTVNAFYAVAVDASNNVYVGGDYTGWNGDAAQKYITEYTAAGTWTAMGAVPFLANEFPGGPRSIAIDQNGYVYVGGYSTAAVTPHLRLWSNSAWSDLGALGANSEKIYVIYIASDGVIYIGGQFTALAGITAKNIIRYNRSSFVPLGAGLTGTNSIVGGIAQDNSGMLWVQGYFNLPYSTTFYGIGIWNGSVWVFPDILTPQNGNSGGNVAISQNNIYLGWFNEASTTSTAAALTTVTNSGSEPAYPVITFTGPGTVVQIENNTTGDILSFNLTLQAGEVATLNLTQGNISFISNWRGNIISTLLAGSNYGFKLQPGANSISVFITGSTAATAVDMRWTPQYLGIEH